VYSGTYRLQPQKVSRGEHGAAKTDEEIQLWKEHDQVAKRQLEIYNRLVELIWDGSVSAVIPLRFYGCPLIIL
jgi:hypothetical protein